METSTFSHEINKYYSYDGNNWTNSAKRLKQHVI